MWTTILVARRVVTHDVVSVHWIVHSVVGVACGWVALRRVGVVAASLVVALVVGIPAWSASHGFELGDYDGVARIVEEPVETGALRVVFDIDGRRYVSYLYGSSAGRLSRCRFGDVVVVRGNVESCRRPNVCASRPATSSDLWWSMRSSRVARRDHRLRGRRIAFATRSGSPQRRFVPTRRRSLPVS